MARALALFIAACASLAGAAPNEIKVFTDELAAFHAHTLETHVNKARTGPLRLMPEYSYGIWHDWELSLQLPLAFGSDAANGEGYRAELQYVAPHDEQRGFYWGLNVELARDHRIGEPHFWNLEIIPILGLRVERWHFVANPGFERALSGQERRASATPAAKLAYPVMIRMFWWMMPIACRAVSKAACSISRGMESSANRTSTSAWVAARRQPRTAG